MRRLEVDSLSNQNISSALLVGTYTADADRALFVRLFADQISGGGDYIAYVKVQRLGTGTEFQAVNSTMSVESGITNMVIHTTVIPVKSTDVVKVYLKGLGGDTTTPDITCEFWEDNATTLEAGSTSWTITITDGSNPLDGVDVWVTTDLAGTNLVARGTTNASGEVTFLLDVGLYYCWKQLTGYTFTNPESFTVS